MKQKIPVKEEYTLYNFCKQFSEGLINPFNNVYSSNWEWQEYMVENYREHWEKFIEYFDNPNYLVFTVINNNDNLSWKVVNGLWKINREGYFIFKLKNI